MYWNELRHEVVEKGVGVVAFYDGVTATANVLEEVSVMPVKYIERLEKDVHEVNGSLNDTICIDFCAGNDACVLTTIYSVLKHRNISLVGGTGDGGRYPPMEKSTVMQWLMHWLKIITER